MLRLIYLWIMKLIKEDIFSLEEVDAICLTTNGFVKRSGAAVMGAGVAKQAKERWRWIDYTLGENIELFGNTLGLLTVKRDNAIFIREPEWFTSLGNNRVPYHIVSFPVKPDRGICSKDKEDIVPWARNRYKEGQEIPGWHMKADLDIIEQSAFKLRVIVDQFNWKSVAISAPGCGNGNLKWLEVKPILDKYFDDRFLITFFG